MHIAEKLRANEQVVAQVKHNTREQALKAELPSEAMKAVASAMMSHRTLAKELLLPELVGRRELLFRLLYNLILNPEHGSKLVGRGQR